MARSILNVPLLVLIVAVVEQVIEGSTKKVSFRARENTQTDVDFFDSKLHSIESFEMIEYYLLHTVLQTTSKSVHRRNRQQSDSFVPEHIPKCMIEWASPLATKHCEGRHTR
jgi:hypothetical protein